MVDSIRLEPGVIFAREYRVLRLLAEGGMGAVYVTEQLSTGVLRALKVMRPALLLARDPAVAAKNRERFLQEARVGARIESEHVVAVVGAGIDEASGAPWMAMELLQGADLRATLEQRGKLTPEEVLEVFGGLCHALGAAHRAGVLHLDLKPENIFVAQARRFGALRTIKVLDFGIARLMLESRRAVTVTTTLGSPMWMAPEQSQRGQLARPSTDVWALGLIAFRLLTGRHYWREGNVPEIEFNTMGWLMEMMTGPLDPATRRAMEHREALPSGFDGWFSRCVARDPLARFADATEAFSALEPLLRGGATPQGPRGFAPTTPLATVPLSSAPGVYPLASPGWGPATAPPQASQRARRLLWVAAALGATVLTAGAVLGALWVLGGDEPEVPARAPGHPRVVTVSAGGGPRPPRSPAPTCPDGMATLPAGTFQMGEAPGSLGSRGAPAHAVRLSAFCMDRSEVTVAAYRACALQGVCAQSGSEAGCNGPRSDRDSHPINCVEWRHAEAYCRAQNNRLPTEAEWEYAARGTDGRVYPWGSTPPAGQLCWNRRSPDSTCEVGSHPAGDSPFGLHDLEGNVAEWVADWSGTYDVRMGAAEVNPTGPLSGMSRQLRGAAWRTDDASDVRAACHGVYLAVQASPTTGFRCARSLAQ